MHRLLGLSALLAACQQPQIGSDFLDDLREQGYREFARAPGWETPRAPAQGGPHGPFVDIYMNDTVEEVFAAGDPLDAWPDGSLIVKDGWNDENGDSLKFVAAMEKRDDKWFWAEYRGNDEVVAEGIEHSTCAGCHSAGSDSVRAFALPR